MQNQFNVQPNQDCGKVGLSICTLIRQIKPKSIKPRYIILKTLGIIGYTEGGFLYILNMLKFGRCYILGK